MTGILSWIACINSLASVVKIVQDLTGSNRHGLRSGTARSRRIRPMVQRPNRH